MIDGSPQTKVFNYTELDEALIAINGFIQKIKSHDTKKIHAIGLMLAGAIIFAGGIFLFMTIYATVNEPTTLRGMIGLSTIGLQPWLSAVLCLTGIIL